MALWNELFSDWVGTLSFLVIVFMLGMAVFFIRYFVSHMMKDPGPTGVQRASSDGSMSSQVRR